MLGSNVSIELGEDFGDFADLEIVSLSDAMAMPETGASSGISSCNSCSCCASTSCCSVNINLP